MKPSAAPAAGYVEASGSGVRTSRLGVDTILSKPAGVLALVKQIGRGTTPGPFHLDI